VIKLTAHWLRNDPPHELEFEGFSDGRLTTRTGASSEAETPKRYHSPKDLVALGIAGCTGVDVVSILKKMRQPLERFVIETELTQTSEHPRVFDSCKLTYRLAGEGLAADRVARAVALSYGKYCGVSAMIKRSGCHFEPQVFLNDQDLTDEFLSVLAEQEQESSDVHPTVGAQAGLLITGNEILFGKTQETNGRFLAQNLIQSGFRISELRVVGDDRAKLRQSLVELLAQNDVVIMTGGLGPTKDDLTSEIVSSVTNLPLKFSQQAWDVCLSAFAKLGRTEIPDSNKKQAMLPEGAVMLNNSLGTAAGFAVHFMMQGRNKTLVALPGVPWECEAMYVEQAKSLLGAADQSVGEWGPWIIWGMGESAIQSLISEIESEISKKLPQVDFSFQAHAGYVTYLIRSQQQAAEQQALDLTNELTRLEAVFGAKLLYTGRETLLQRLLQTYRETGLSLALAESCTGGRIAAEVTSISGSSDIFSGGVVAYSNEIKKNILGVSESTLENHGAVSLVTAAQMAEGISRQFGAAVSLSVTGIAGPSGGSASKPVGTVCFALALQGLFKRVGFDKVKFETSFGRLSTQGWSFVDGGDSVLVVEKQFGQHLPRELIQKRASLFALCSLVALGESLRSLPEK
jgi:nicotinamide-nucleotide amidase